MTTLFDTSERESIRRRLAALSPDATRRWGTMSVEGMLAHLADQIGFALGERTAPPARGILTLRLVQWLTIVVLPWPHGMIKASHHLLSTVPESFEHDRDALRELLDRFAEIEGRPSPHPMLGELSRDLWGHLAARHFDYHLRQFGA